MNQTPSPKLLIRLAVEANTKQQWHTTCIILARAQAIQIFTDIYKKTEYLDPKQRLILQNR